MNEWMHDDDTPRREEMTTTTPKSAPTTRCGRQALRAAMDAVANPTRVDASTPTPASSRR